MKEKTKIPIHKIFFFPRPPEASDRCSFTPTLVQTPLPRLFPGDGRGGDGRGHFFFFGFGSLLPKDRACSCMLLKTIFFLFA
jgi:hypothetical protein